MKFSVWIVMMAISFGFAFVAKLTWDLSHSIGFTSAPLIVSFFCFLEALTFEREEVDPNDHYDPTEDR